MYVVAEEDSTHDSGAIIILSSNWLTPKKCEAFWPTVKNQGLFNKLLKNHENPNEDWNLIKIKRKFYESEDLLIARKKARDAEFTSDLTDVEGVRKRNLSKRAIQFSSEDEEDDVFSNHQNRKSLKKKQIFENSGVPGEPNDLNTQSISQLEHAISGTSFETSQLNPSFNESSSNQQFISSPIPPDSAKFPASKYKTCESNASTGLASSPISCMSNSAKNAIAKTAFEYNLIQLLTTIKEQNTVILEWIRKQNAKDFQFKNTDLQLPVEFPLQNYDDLLKLELFLASDHNFTDFCEYFNQFAGPTTTGTVNAILKHTLTNQLAATFSFRGKKGKRAFEDLNLKTAIIRATKKICSVVRDQPIENDIKVWLKHAPQRVLLQEKKINARLNRIN